MRRHKVREDLVRERVGDYALPLGLEPLDLPEPIQGYVLDYVPGDGGDAGEAPQPGEDTFSGQFTSDPIGPDAEAEEAAAPDTYSFQVTVSHERLLPIFSDALRLLGEEVLPVLEIGSRDSFRAMDVYMSRDPIPLGEFIEGFREYAGVLLEDANIGIGANSEEPFVEVFLDSWKGLLVSVPIAMRRRVERLLARHGLREVMETWPPEMERRIANPTRVREVLLVEDDQAPDLEEVLMQLRERFGLEINIDPTTNIDDAGKSIGRTLWHVVAVAESVSRPRAGAYLNCWLASGSLVEVEELVRAYLESEHPDLEFASLYTADRVAHDERPEELNGLPPRLGQSAVLLAQLDPW